MTQDKILAERVATLTAYCAKTNNTTRTSEKWKTRWWYSKKYNFLYCMVFKVCAIV